MLDKLRVLSEWKLSSATKVSEGLYQVNVLYSSAKLMLILREKKLTVKLFVCIQIIYYFVWCLRLLQDFSVQ